MTDTAWRATKPKKSDIGRIVLKEDPTITYPVQIFSAGPTYYTCTLRGATGITEFRIADTVFQTPHPPLPTTPGSSIWWYHPGREENIALILDGNAWGNQSYGGLDTFHDITAPDSMWALIHDTGADK
jgi:hypothetical protein